MGFVMLHPKTCKGTPAFPNGIFFDAARRPAVVVDNNRTWDVPKLPAGLTCP
jgi:hypothetical protein